MKSTVSKRAGQQAAIQQVFGTLKLIYPVADLFLYRLDYGIKKSFLAEQCMLGLHKVEVVLLCVMDDELNVYVEIFLLLNIVQDFVSVETLMYLISWPIVVAALHPFSDVSLFKKVASH